jgi:rRNA-processing protein FCF1
MAVLLDANYLIALHQPHKLDVPDDPATGIAISNFPARLDYLVSQLELNKSRIVIPTPVMSEFLVRADAAGASMVADWSKNKNFRIADFGRRAAIEAAEIIRHEIDVLGKGHSRPDTWAKAKFDIQIVAIGKIENVTTAYTNDQGLANKCRRNGIAPVLFHELPEPPDDTLPLLKFAES